MAIQIELEPKGNNSSSPIFIHDDNTVSWADLEDGQTLKLLGFVNYFSTARKELLDVDYQIFRTQYHMAVGKFPVFTNADDEWVGINQKVASVDLTDEE